MKKILELTTCRGELYMAGRAHLELPKFRILDDNTGSINIRSMMNPEFIFQTKLLLQLAADKNLLSIVDDANDMQKRVANYIENTTFDGYIIEISSLKRPTQELKPNHHGEKYNEEEFNSELDCIKSLIHGKPILWLSHANILFDDEHLSEFDPGWRSRIFKDSRLRSRQTIDEYLTRRGERVIMPSQHFKNKTARDVFKSKTDTGHYNKESELYIKNIIVTEIIKFASEI